MFDALIAIAALVSSDVAAGPVTSTVSTVSATRDGAKTDRFAGRPQARIAFTQQVRNFQIKREDRDDILYLETSRDRWFRSEIYCFGINDPRDAQGLASLDNSSGFDSFSRVALVGFGHETTQCQLKGLIELTPSEAVDLNLVRRRAAASGRAAPAS